MDVLRVAVGQDGAACGDLEANAAAAARLTAMARTEGARLLVLPEAFLTGYCAEAFSGIVPRPEDLAMLLEPVVEAAGGALDVVLSSPVDRGARRTLSSVLVSAAGTVSVPYDKQHLVGVELDHFTAGSHGASIVVEGWELGLSICYDACFPEHARAAADDGAHGYLNSAAYFPGGEHRRDIYCAARALDNGLFVASSQLTGACGGTTFIGGSAIHDPEGRALAKLGTEPGIAVADWDPALQAATRAAHTMHADHRAGLGERTRAGGPFPG